MRYYLLLFTFCLALPCTSLAQRTTVALNNNWHFRFSHEVERNAGRRVDLPHTWNVQDALAGQLDYKRGMGNYQRSLDYRKEWNGKRVFLQVEAANSICNAFLNGTHLGKEHRGGYTAFRHELTGMLKEKNTLLLMVNNAEQTDVLPLVGDFVQYGGLYRGVNIIATDSVCIMPKEHGGPGVRIVQDSVSNSVAHITAVVDVNSIIAQRTAATVVLRVWNNNKLVGETRRDISLDGNGKTASVALPLTIHHPRLWNGREDPFLYRTEVSIVRNNKTVDTVEQPMGLRYFHTDANEGFFLNGKPLKLRGVCRHQDRAEVGNALCSAHHKEDAQLIYDMGANAVRLAHYPQAPEFYSLMDSMGIIVWAEIPFVGPGGYADTGYINTPSLWQNAEDQLQEMILQHFNHPSICMWGLFNELSDTADSPLPLVRKLNDLAHATDPTRPTTAASNLGYDHELHSATDLIAWNRYDGWYGATTESLATWLDNVHKKHPQLHIALSEYGAGASIYHQQDTLVQTVPNSWWHPENWQTHYHIQNWRIINDRPFVWGSFVWNMFDFAAAHRREGDRPGINDKGLVTFDRKTKKDAYYFYQANWNSGVPVLHIAGKRNAETTLPTRDVMVFTNLPSATLFLNGKKISTLKPDTLSTIVWRNLPLTPGVNNIKVVGGKREECFCLVFL